jgi:hypothetical protein
MEFSNNAIIMPQTAFSFGEKFHQQYAILPVLE